MAARWTREAIQAWWALLLSAARDVAALTVGVWILLFRTDATTSLQAIGFLLLTLSTAGAAKAALRVFAGGTGNGNGGNGDGNGG